jgi:hypothetical protein
MDENKLKTIVEEVVNKAVDPIKETLRDHTKMLEDHTRRLETLSGDMEQVFTEVKATHDEIGLWHQRDKREIDEIKKHLDLPLVPDVPQA